MGQPHDNFVTSAVSAIGTACHEKIAEIAEERKQPDWLIEHTVSLAGISGTLDLYADYTVTDWKTTSHRGMETIGIHGPYLSQKYQVHFYGAAAAAEGLRVDKVRICYLCRDCGGESTYESHLDMAIVREALDWRKWVESTAIEWLPRIYAPDSVFCAGCPFLNACWSGGVPGRHPLSVEYRDPEGKRLIDELRETRKQQKALKDRERIIKGTLDAVRPNDGSVVVLGDEDGAESAVQWRGFNQALYVVPVPDKE